MEFNAWRYEREAHVLVPLLRTIERTLDDYADAIDLLPIVEAAAPPPAAAATGIIGIEGASALAAADALARTVALRPEKKKERRTELARWIGGKAKLAGLCAIAMTRAVKLNVLGLDVAPAEAVKGVREELALHAKAQEAAATEDAAEPFEEQSFYYNLFAHLRRLTRGDEKPGEPRLNLVFLIDDLDRCLPEKAVEMLESIKLFLDVQGCVFVLAVDDEVVERGIAHRYRDYLDVTDRATESIAHSLHPDHYRAYLGRYATNRQAPITGSEYLEKIVQLAIRLPRFSRKQATDLLRQQAPDLFVPSSPAPGAEPSEWLLDLFLDAVPPVPRKLIRAADLLVFVRQLAERQGVLTQLHPYTLAQLSLLQVFAPQMFRYLSRRDRLTSWTRLDARLQSAQNAAGSDIYGSSFFDWWEKEIEGARTAIKENRPDRPTVSLTELERYEEPFIAELRQACTGRSGFDPRKLFLPSLTVDRNLRPYINLLAEEGTSSGPPGNLTASVPPGTVTVAAPVPAAAQPPAAAPAPTPPAVVTSATAPAASAPPATVTGPASAAPRELGNFVDLLLSPHEDSWHGALDSEPSLQGRGLDRRSFTALRDAITKREFAITGRWLNVVGVVLSDSQTKELLVESKALAAGISHELLDALTVGELIEAACQKLVPWDAPVTDVIQPEEIGLPEGSKVERREWAYRYRRGLGDNRLGETEPVLIWRGYSSSLSSPLHSLREIRPGLLAASTSDGHVRLLSRAFRGQWAIQGHFAGPATTGYSLTPLSPFHVVGITASDVVVWHQQEGTWNRVYERFHGSDLRRVAALSPDRFVVLGAGILLTPFRSPARATWTPLPATPGTFNDVVALDAHQLLAVGPITIILFSFTANGLKKEANVSLDGTPTSIVKASGERVVCTLGRGELRLVRVEATGAGVTLATASSRLSGAHLVDPNSDLVLVRNDEAFEVWSTAGDALRLIGEGSMPRAQDGGGAPVNLLHDGRVACGVPGSGVQLQKPTTDGLYAFDGHIVEGATWSPALAVTGGGTVMTHPGGALFLQADAIANGQLITRIGRMLKAERSAFVNVWPISATEVLLLDSQRNTVVWNLLDGATQRPPFDAPSTAVVQSQAGVHMGIGSGTGSAIVQLMRESDGKWIQLDPIAAAGVPLEGLVAATVSGRLFAWGGSKAIVLDPGHSQPSAPFDVPHRITSAEPLPAGWQGRQSLVLVCGVGGMYLVDLDSRTFEPWLQSGEDIVAAAGFRVDGTITFGSDGHVHLFDGPAHRATYPDLLHGWPAHLESLSNNSVQVYGVDDAWYQITSFKAATRISRGS